MNSSQEKNGANAGLVLRIRSLHPSLPKVHKRIAEKILDNPGNVINESVTELAEEANASVASIVLFCKKLGLRGYHDLKLRLAEEVFQADSDIHEEIHKDDDTATIIKKVFNTSIQTLKDSYTILDEKAVEKAALTILNAKRVLIFGTGLSSVIAKDFWIKLFRINFNIASLTNQTTMKMAAVLAEPGDVVFAVSHSGSTKAVISAIMLAKERGAAIIGLTNYQNSPMTKHLDILLLTSSRETGVREEEMTSRIAQLAVVDALFVSVTNKSYEQSSGFLRKTRAAVSDDKI